MRGVCSTLTPPRRGPYNGPMKAPPPRRRLWILVLLCSLPALVGCDWFGPTAPTPTPAPTTTAPGPTAPPGTAPAPSPARGPAATATPNTSSGTPVPQGGTLTIRLPQ